MVVEEVVLPLSRTLAGYAELCLSGRQLAKTTALAGALTLVFCLIHLIPGDPVEVMLGETASAADKEELRRALGLDRSLFVQYASFLSGLARGSLGRSLYEQGGVAELTNPRTALPEPAARCILEAVGKVQFATPKHGATRLSYSVRVSQAGL